MSARDEFEALLSEYVRVRVVPDNRVEALAPILAGFAFPGHGRWSNLSKGQRAKCRRVAREALITLMLLEGGES